MALSDLDLIDIVELLVAVAILATYAVSVSQGDPIDDPIFMGLAGLAAIAIFGDNARKIFPMAGIETDGRAE